MILRKDEAETETRENMRDGKGTVKIVKHVPASAMAGKCRLCATLVLRPGCSIGFHKHEDEREIFIVQKGNGVIDDNGTKSDIAEGDAILTGDGAGHAVENTGKEDLRLTAVILT